MNHIGNLALALADDEGAEAAHFPLTAEEMRATSIFNTTPKAEHAARRSDLRAGHLTSTLGGTQLQPLGGAIRIGSSSDLLTHVTTTASNRRRPNAVNVFPAASLSTDQPSCFTVPQQTPRSPEPPRQVWAETPPYLALARDLIQRDDIAGARKMLDAAPSDADTLELRRLRILLSPPNIARTTAVDTDRSREYQSLTRHWSEYRGQWVAVDGDDIVASAETLKGLREVLKTLHLRKPPLVHRLS